MKKVFLLAALLVASMSMMAEEPQSAMNQVVWQNGKVMYGSPIPTVDSITFAAEIESSDTLHLILPRTIIKEVHDTTVQIVEVHDTIIKIVEVHDTIYKCPDEPADSDAPLAGVFSVAADKQVKFSKGNLQYTQSTNTWAFAAQQYEMLGTANVENSALADKIDLFGWSGSTGSAKWGIGTSTDYNDYSGDFVDWGQNIGDGNTPDGFPTSRDKQGQGWRTLTSDEWNYLCSSRANAASLMGVARINLDAEGTTYANGLILLPDTWTCPEGITFKSGFASENSIQAYADYQTFTLEQWATLEASGAVFLPASGLRGGSGVGYVQDGYYWSATPLYSYFAYYLCFGSNVAGCNDYFRYNGQAVRLVQDL